MKEIILREKNNKISCVNKPLISRATKDFIVRTNILEYLGYRICYWENDKVCVVARWWLAPFVKFWGIIQK